MIVFSHVIFNRPKSLCYRLDNLCKERGLYEYKYGGNLLGAWGFKEVMESSIIGIPKLYDFEDTVIYGVEKYNEYLSHLYGDWRQLPPKEKQISHHDYYIELNKSYLNEFE